jgi:hypothetical protein
MSTTPLRVCVKAYAASHQFQRGVWGGGVENRAALGFLALRLGARAISAPPLLGVNRPLQVFY